MLEKIKSAEDVKKLSQAELPYLAKELRKRIIDVTLKNGGHLAPSLGAVELAVALCYTFNPLKDRLVWDVGHQAYAYKLLTGRNDSFDTLRRMDGVGGFLNPAESPADAFRVGHSSTSISAALGIQTALDLQKKNARAVAVIGDGALTGGMAFEALNHAGHMQKNIIVILNDNEMSISPNVGALQHYLANMLVSRSYNKLKKQVWDLSASLPKNLRSAFITGSRKLEGSLKNIVVPNIIFEDLGFKYVGPVDGHSLPRLVSILNQIKDNISQPVLLHVITHKGRGFELAENDATRWHGISPQKTEAELAVPVQKPWSQVFGDSLTELAAGDKRICAVTAAMCDGTGLAGFAKKYPDRFFDVGIAEQHAVTFACGLAITGLKPFVAIYSTFMQRGYDQLIHDAALQKLPVVFCLDRAGLVGEDGPTHHGSFDLSFLNCVPGLVILAPSNREELQLMLTWAAGYNAGPVAIRYPRGGAPDGNPTPAPLQLGGFRVVENTGELALIGIGTAYGLAAAVHALIKQKHPQLQVQLVDARFAKPLDNTWLQTNAPGLKGIVSFEYNALPGGFGSALRDAVSAYGTPVLSFGYPDEFVVQGKVSELDEMLGLTPSAILAKLQAVWPQLG